MTGHDAATSTVHDVATDTVHDAASGMVTVHDAASGMVPDAATGTVSDGATGTVAPERQPAGAEPLEVPPIGMSGPVAPSGATSAPTTTSMPSTASAPSTPSAPMTTSGPAAGAGGAGRPARSTGLAAGTGQPGRSALARCVTVDPATFAAEHWGRAALLSRAVELGNPDGFRDLLSPADADELLSRRGLRTPFLRVAKNGKVLPTGEYTGGGGAGAEIADQVLDERVLALYADGATLVLQGLHRTWPALIDFTRELSQQLGQPLQVNAYLTPPGNQGFATHYDTHDVFVLQVDGHKHWQIHEPVLPDPLERQPWGGRADEVAAVADGPPALDVVLGPGDALYLPRGWLHSARAQDESSLHLTVGVRALTRYAMVEALLELAAEDRRLRGTLPFGMDVADADQVEPELTETVEALRDWLLTADPGAVAARLRSRNWPAARPAPIRPLAQAAAIAAVDADTRLAPRAGLRWRLTTQPDGDREGPGRVVLSLFDRTVSFPAQCTSALRAFLTGEVQRVGDLPGLDDDASRTVLARRLLREAIAVPEV